MSKRSIEHASKFVNPDYKHVIEFGVWEGYSLRILRDLFPKEYKVYGFDSFEGMPEDWVGTPCMKGSFSTQGKTPEIPDVRFFKGWFADTLPEYIKEAEPIAMIHMDCDLYSSTKTALDNVHPFIREGTIIAFDEWYYHSCEGCNDHEQKAFLEYAEKHNISYEIIPFDNTDPLKEIDTRIVRITSIHS